MIPSDEVRDSVHILLDSLSEKGSTQDYYIINHSSAKDVDALVFLVLSWLRHKGI